MAKNRLGLGPYSRLLARGSVDGRSREGRYLAALKTELNHHVGGNPSIAERLLIDRLAQVALRLQLFDEKMAAGELTDHDARVYGALHNALRLMLREVGVKPSAQPPLSLADYIATQRRS
jgi:hypothetical protein